MLRSPRHTLYFSAFHVSSDIDLLYRGSSVIPLEPCAVRVLRYLAAHHDRVVSKEELLDSIWPGVCTTDDVLKRAILKARRALGDKAQNSVFIKTYHGRGYRFVATVTVCSLSETGHFDAPTASAKAGSAHRAERGRVQDGAPVLAEPKAGPDSKTVDPDYDHLVGRVAELAALCAEYRRTLGGKGRPVLIIGEPGIGKTQLARHFQSWAGQEGALYLYARFFDYKGGRLAPYEVFLDLLRAGVDAARLDNQTLPDDPADLRASLEARYRITLPEELFGRAVTPFEPSQGKAGRSDCDNYRVVVPIARCFIRLSHQHPTIMVLDDLQWADEASLHLVGYLMRTAQSEPLMIVALAREEEVSAPDTPLAQWLKCQAKYCSYTSLALKPLDESACGDMIEAVFGANPHRLGMSPNELRILYRVTGGNPYFVVEMLRLLIAEGAIVQSGACAAGWRWQGINDLSLPTTIVMAAHAKLDRLSEPVRDIVEQASVIGDEFRVQTLSHLADKDEEQVELLLREAIHRGVLSGHGVSASEDYRFYHTILRRVLYEGLSPRRRKQLHRRAAQAIEAIYASDADRLAEALSEHYEAACEFRKASDWAMRAWRASSSRSNWKEAVGSIERAHRAAGKIDRLKKDQQSTRERVILLLRMGESYYRVGRLNESARILADTVTLAESLDDKATLAAALLGQARTRVALSWYCEATKPLEQAIVIYGEINDQEGIASALLEMGKIQVAMGNYDVAAQLIERALEGLNEASGIAALALGSLGWTRTLQGRYSEGVPLLERALAYHERRSDVSHGALLLRRLHWAHLSRGQYEMAINLAVRARDRFRDIGDVYNEAGMDMGIGQARTAQGLYEEGIKFLNSALDKFCLIGSAHPEAESLWLLGRAHCEAGRGAEAATMLARSLEIVARVGDRDDEFRILTDIARSEISEQHFLGGLEAANKAVAIAEHLQNRDGLGTALVECARAHLKLNRLDESLEAAERAVKLLEETGSGERWRAYWALASSLKALHLREARPQTGRALFALRRCVELLATIREQLDPSDAVRRAGVTHARSEPARDLRALLLRVGLTSEAESISRDWLINHAASGAVSNARA